MFIDIHHHDKSCHLNSVTSVKQRRPTVTPHHFTAVTLSSISFLWESISSRLPRVFRRSLERSTPSAAGQGALKDGGGRWMADGWPRRTEGCWWTRWLNVAAGVPLKDWWSRAERVLGGAEGGFRGERTNTISACGVQWRIRCTGMSLHWQNPEKQTHIHRS